MSPVVFVPMAIWTAFAPRILVFATSHAVYKGSRDENLPCS